MTNDRPLFSADWHARRAEHLTDLAASMNGWWQRGRRRDLLAAAQVHATLGAVAMPAGNYVERLALADIPTTAEALLPKMTWASDGVTSAEPPSYVMAVRESRGHIADRTETSCEYCGPPGTEWRWRHNGGTECWLDMDGIGPWTQVPEDPRRRRP
jgi:hypothetical protein